MSRVFFLLFFLLFAPVVEAKTKVLVSVAPQKYLVERIGCNEVEVQVLVPAGASPHTYEPSPKQVIKAQEGEIWFRIGEGFERQILPVLSKIEVVDQRDGLPLLEANGCSCCAKEGHDPHIWLSPALLKKLARQIEETLSTHDPENRLAYSHNLRHLEEDLDRQHEWILSQLAGLEGKSLLVSHPAFGYFCHDYHLNQLSIEMEGREPTPRYLIHLVDKARSEKIQTVFLQKQYNTKGGKRIARELNAETVYLDPYAENVLENLFAITEAFAQG
ncbi:MAG: putative periplasmic iron-binding protein [Chlamydiae bacterium]|nr:putative periplasmic iron-binding protein [Chlamydiota bacterium]